MGTDILDTNDPFCRRVYGSVSVQKQHLHPGFFLFPRENTGRLSDFLYFVLVFSPIRNSLTLTLLPFLLSNECENRNLFFATVKKKLFWGFFCGTAPLFPHRKASSPPNKQTPPAALRTFMLMRLVSASWGKRYWRSPAHNELLDWIAAGT